MSDERTRRRLKDLLTRINARRQSGMDFGPGRDAGRMRLLSAQAREIEELIDDPWLTRHVEDEPREAGGLGANHEVD